MPLDIRRDKRPPHCISTLGDPEIQLMLQEFDVSLNKSIQNLSSTSKRSTQTDATAASNAVSNLLPHMGLIPSERQPCPKIGAETTLSLVAPHKAESVDGNSTITTAIPYAPVIDRANSPVVESREMIGGVAIPANASQDSLENEARPNADQNERLERSLETGSNPIVHYQSNMLNPVQEFRMRNAYN